MLQIDDKIINLDVLMEKFNCNIEVCKGACCFYGDYGAPLEKRETELLEREYPKIKKYLRKAGIKAIEASGTSMIDSDGDTVTPLIEGKECAFAIVEKGIYRCAIELAFAQGEIEFRKPISCHLYPVRTKLYKDFEAVNYDRWSICRPAVELGCKMDMPVFRFLKEALIRKYGKSFYQQIETAAEQMLKLKI